MIRNPQWLLPTLVMSLAAFVSMTVREANGQPPADQGTTTGKTVTLHVGQSQVVGSPRVVKRVSVTEPKIADVKILTTDQVLVMGKAIGATDLLMWGEKEELWQAKVVVTPDLDYLKADLAKLFPDSTLDVTQSLDMVVLTGKLARAEQIEQVHRFMDATKLKYVDMSSLAGVQQVQLQVRMAEVSRQAIRTLGINAFFAGTDFFGGSVVGADGSGPINPISIGTPAGSPVGKFPFIFNRETGVSQAVTLFAGVPDWDFEIFLQALAENQYLRLLAEPNLLALSGQEASFLAGGEYPIPVVQAGVGGGNSITIQYKEFGVRLRFRPTVLGDGTIRLFVAPEVSELSDIGAVVMQGFRVPSLITRRAETTLELKSGQTFGMAGLINHTNSARSSRVPALGDMPIMGALFRSVRYAQGETELVVLVTASLVEPINAACPPPLPGDTHQPPSDWELYAKGRIEGKPAKLSSEHTVWLKENCLDRLKGPGAWACPGDDAAPARPTAAPAATKPAGSSGK